MPPSTPLNPTTLNPGRSQGNGETQYSRSQYRSILGWPDSRSTRDFATYAIDWQPGYVSWYVDGKLLKHSRQGDLGKNNRRFQVRGTE